MKPRRMTTATLSRMVERLNKIEKELAQAIAAVNGTPVAAHLIDAGIGVSNAAMRITVAVQCVNTLVVRS